MTIIELYQSILKSVNFVVGDDHLVSYVIGSNKVPVQVSAKRLVLPVHDVLANPDWANTIAFHPLSEAIIRGESPVFRKLKIACLSRLTTVATCLVTELMGIAVDHDYHKKLSPTQNEFLDLIPNVKEETLTKLEKLLDVVSIDGDHRFVNMYIKRGGEYKGKKFQRVCVVDFPLIQELKSEGTYACGVNLNSLKNKKAITALFNYVLPDAEGETYSFGSNSLAAPNLHALLTSYAKIAGKLNKVTNLFKKHLDNPADLHIELGFEKHIADLAQYRDLIPSLSGNEGDSGEAAEPASKPHTHPQVDTSKFAQAVVDRESAAKPAPAAPAAFTPPWDNQPGQTGFAAQPAPTPAPAPTSGSGLSWNSVVSHNPALQQQQAMMQQQQRFSQPGLFRNQPQQQFQQPQQVTRGGYVQPAQPQGFFNQQPQGFNQPAVMFPNGI
ncbi:hypothetical protein D3C85_107970 [compost metagenome]